MKRRWDKKEINFIKQNYMYLTNKKLSYFLNRSENSVKFKLWKLKLNRKKANYLPEKRTYSITPELGYIIGVILGDGNLKRNVIRLSTKDKDFAKYFASQLEKWCGKKPVIYKRVERKVKFPNSPKVYKTKPVYEVYLFSKICANIVKKNIESLKKWVKNTNKNIKKALLKGLWDSEGCISYNGFFKNFNPKIRKLFITLCKEFKIGVTEDPKQNLVRANGIKEVIKYHQKIGITIKRKRKKIEEIIKKYKIRTDLYKKVISLRKKGLGPNLIYKKLNSLGISLPYTTICYWLYLHKKPRVMVEQ